MNKKQQMNISDQQRGEKGVGDKRTQSSNNDGTTQRCQTDTGAM